VAYNPFVGLPGQRRQITDLAVDRGAVPPPIDAPASTVPAPVAVPGAAVPANGFVASNKLSDPFVPPTRIAALDNPTLSPARRALDGLLRDRSGYLVQGLSVRSNNGESGLSKITEVDTPFEARMPVGDLNVALRATPVSLSSGAVKAISAARFGAGAGEDKAKRENGVGLAVAVEDPAQGVKADIGVSPLGFTYNTVVGGVSVNRPFTEGGNLRYGVNVSRRPVTDSVTSFAGSTARITDADGQVHEKKWGGVTANGGRAELSYDDQEVGAYGYASLHQLLGNNVEDNTRMELGSGVYWYLRNTPTDTLTLGVSGMAMGFKDNQGFYTYGQGGYFSPQRFFSLAVPVRWAQSFDRFSYELKSSVGVQHIAQDGADYFPTESRLQDNAATKKYDSSSKTGASFGPASR
jgi:hypothetical protein